MVNKYKLIFLRPKKITRFRIQDGIFSDTSLRYIPADTIYSLYLSKLYEDKIISNNDKEEIKKIELPKITSAYPYFIKNNNIYFYLPLPFIDVQDKKFRKKCRNYNIFISVKYLNRLLEDSDKTLNGIREMERRNEEYKVWAPIKHSLVARNTVNRITSTTSDEGSLFVEEYVFCYENNKEEMGYYFLIEQSKEAKEFLQKVREFFEIRGIGADKSISNSVFNLGGEEVIKSKLKDFEREKNKLFEIIEKLREENFVFHPLIINKDTKEKIQKAKLRYLVVDGRYIYPIASDGSQLKEKIENPIIVEMKRNFSGRLRFRVFYGI